jgi:hypothetical protein
MPWQSQPGTYGASNPDSDFDGIIDGQDEDSFTLRQDSDSDGFSDADEAQLGLDPFNPDSDGDRHSDAYRDSNANAHRHIQPD